MFISRVTMQNYNKNYSKKCLLLQDVFDVLYAVCVFCMLCVFCCFVWRVLRNGAMVSKTVYFRKKCIL